MPLLCSKGQEHNSHNWSVRPCLVYFPLAFTLMFCAVIPYPASDVTMSHCFQPQGLCMCCSSRRNLLFLALCSFFGFQLTCQLLEKISPEFSLPPPHPSIQKWVPSATWPRRILLSLHCTQNKFWLSIHSCNYLFTACLPLWDTRHEVVWLGHCCTCNTWHSAWHIVSTQ